MRRAPDSKEFIFKEKTFLEIEFNRLAFCSKERNKRGFYDDKIQFIFENITQMKDLLDQKGIQFLVAIYPDEFQVNPALLEKLLTHNNVTSEEYEFDLFQRLLTGHLKKLRIPWVDFMDDFKREAKQKPLYKLGDPHWNNAGNDLAAEILFRELKKYIEIP